MSNPARNPGEWLRLREAYQIRDKDLVGDTFILPLVAHSEARGILATGLITIRSSGYDATLSVYISSESSAPQKPEDAVWMPPVPGAVRDPSGGIAGGHAVRDFTLEDAFTAAGDIQRALTERRATLSPEYADDEARRDAEFLVHGLRALIFPKPHSVGAMLGRRR